MTLSVFAFATILVAKRLLHIPQMRYFCGCSVATRRCGLLRVCLPRTRANRRYRGSFKGRDGAIFSCASTSSQKSLRPSISVSRE